MESLKASYHTILFFHQVGEFEKYFKKRDFTGAEALYKSIEHHGKELLRNGGTLEFSRPGDPLDFTLAFLRLRLNYGKGEITTEQYYQNCRRMGL
jgi:hypothetical protein